MLSITKENFEENVKNSDKPVVVDFWAPWCGPCKWLAPVLEELEKEYEGKLIFGKANVDNERELASGNNVSGIPCVIIFKGGKEVDRIVGFNPKEVMKEKLDKILS